MIVFRLPDETVLYTTDHCFSHCSVRFFSFDLKAKASFSGLITPLSPKDFMETKWTTENVYSDTLKETKTEYLNRVLETKNYIQKHQLEKLVLARKKIVSAPQLDIKKTFLNLCKLYPSAFVYLFSYQGDLWIGAFSEILGKYNKKTQIFMTMSLAGTIGLKEVWSEKEILEQESVSKYIHHTLEAFSGNIQKSAPYDHLSGNIKHLCTDFSVHLSLPEIPSLIQKLHPTPAVCGFPKDISLKGLHTLENFDREYYAGYSQIDTPDYLYYFVNLRCAKIYKNSLVLYLGGGITPLSNPEKEWQETERKANGLLGSLVFS
ncbi:MAG: hypothetical protein FDW93_06945 [Bergeyella sp.]|nr:hypothetical protein [Bergeyella sp.]